ncbi:DUF4249 domain-containing protein [Marinilongibacter aquaticus]|uniref:DUF4249 domain-containing protein n=1 Tax=Marinilongibacter aquaticus TaxID=2975157 RepID=UPI0021BDC5F2|nr:DUF4249 domain-containing protein [Marinilongibacter aquaticus]UBM58688.1 DUF4249 domain-containing protein [Marinilongibacter aquaticus]
MNKLPISICLGIFFLACVSPFDYQVKNENKKLVVEGRIFDVDSCYVKVNYSSEGQSYAGLSPISDAIVKVIENGTTAIHFRFHGGAKAFLPENKSFRGTVGNSYQLKIDLPDGNVYTSTRDTLLAAQKPLNITNRFNSTESTMEILVNLGEKKIPPKYQYFNFINYKRANYCASCPNSVRYDKDGNSCTSLFKNCNSTPLNTYSPAGYYGFPCYQVNTCWNYKLIQKFRIFSDKDLANGTNNDINIFRIPRSTTEAYFLEIHQNNIHEEAYEYFKLFESFSNSGSLFDPTPPAIVGNIYNQNNVNDIALGYFLVAGQQVYGLWVKRDEVNAPLITKDPSKEYFEEISNVPSFLYSPGCTSPPPANCQIDGIRTNIKPKDWDSFL